MDNGLEVQVCRVSRMGARIPIGRSEDPLLVRQVGNAILAELRSWRFDDPLLADLAREQATALERDLTCQEDCSGQHS